MMEGLHQVTVFPIFRKSFLKSCVAIILIFVIAVVVVVVVAIATAVVIV